MRRDSHAQWRELIAARLDRPLTRSESRYLSSHLKGCEACRQADHDYREQRELLRALPPRIPPRDLWARTSAALDREVARGAYRGRGLARGLGLDFGSTGRRGTPTAALLTTLATVGVVAMLAVMQVMPALPVTPSSIPVPGKATPFAVNPQPLAFLGSQAADVFLYQVDVAHACPTTEPDCDITQDFVRTAVNLPTSLRARNAALDPSGHALAFVGRSSDRDTIAVVLLDSSDAPTPLATPSVTDPAGSTPPETTSPETPGPETPGPGEIPTDATPLPGETASAPPPSAVPGLRVLAILEDVQSAGAPPDWSPSGDMLAFSAMPADGSTGPDVYVWSPQSERARAVTSDHNSYFASWSGERLVVSRIATADDGGVATRTFVIDPTTLEERRVAGPRIWLPAVNPSGTHAIAWRGEMGLADGLAQPLSGTLYMVDWAHLDPFAPGAEVPPTPEPTDARTPEPPTAEPTAEPTVEPSPSTAPETATPTDQARAEPKSETQPTPAPTEAPAAEPEPTTAPEPSEAAEPDVAPLDVLTELDLGRDRDTQPVLDWQARWSTDGQVLGIWIAAGLGETWGQLTVFAIEVATGNVDENEPLLAATFARRGFSLGESRVAWVAPSDGEDGELRIATWGDDGVGGLRLQPAEVDEVVPAF